MPQGAVPFLKKTCPIGYTIDASTGLCTLFNPWVASGLVGIGLLGLSVGAFLGRRRALQQNPRGDALAVAGISGLGAGIAAGLITKALLGPSPTPKPLIAEEVAFKRRARDVGIANRELARIAVEAGARPVVEATVSCQTGCVCITSTPQWCTTAQAFIRPNDVRFAVDFVPSTSAPPQYKFVDDVAQWIGFFKYEAEPFIDEWCPPLITYNAGVGDCEDLSLLTVSVLLVGGVDARFVVGTFHDPKGDFGHAWVEGVDKEGSFLIEATNGNLYRGARPSMYTPILQVRQGVCKWSNK